jgi:hypothetical protein
VDTANRYKKICDLTPRQSEILRTFLNKYHNAIELIALMAGHEGGAAAVSPDFSCLLDPTSPINAAPASELFRPPNDLPSVEAGSTGAA